MELDSSGVERMRRILRHRLLNIVSGVKSANSLLASELEDRLAPREREYFPLIQKECDQVGIIVERMDAYFGPFPACAPIDVERVINGFRHNFCMDNPMAEVNMDIVLDDPTRKICSHCMQGILNEAVGNAVEISRKPVMVLVRDSDEGGCTISIIDRGDPIPEDVLSMAFDPFFTGRTRHLGLGLAIAKRMVTEQNGTMSIESGPGGNIVNCELPWLDM